MTILSPPRCESPIVLASASILRPPGFLDRDAVGGGGGGPISYFRSAGGNLSGEVQNILKITNFSGDTPYSGASARSFECWLRLPNGGPPTYNAAVFTCGTGAADSDYTTIVESSDNFTFNHWFNDNSIVDFALQYAAWHHFAVTYDGTNEKVYLDGVIQNGASGWNLGTLTTTAGEFWLLTNPSYNGSGKRLEADIFDVRIWSKALSAAEILAGMGSFPVGNETDFVLGAKMQDGAGTPTLYGPASATASVYFDNTLGIYTWETDTDPR